MSSLISYLTAPANTTSREVLLAHRTIYELKLAAARRGYDLRTFVPDVDRDGYDVVLDDGDTSVRIQLKATFNDAAAPPEIHKGLIRPTMYACDELGFESSPTGVGMGGGVLQQIVHVDGDDLQLSYRYTDVRILLAFHWELRSGPRRDARDNVIRSLKEGSGSSRVTLQPSLMVTPKNSDCLLALMGLHSNAESHWHGSFLRLARETRGQGPRDANDLPHLQNEAREALDALIAPSILDD